MISRLDETVWKCRRAKITRGDNNPVYCICLALYLYANKIMHTIILHVSLICHINLNDMITLKSRRRHTKVITKG